jgi:hypothetical protein
MKKFDNLVIIHKLIIYVKIISKNVNIPPILLPSNHHETSLTLPVKNTGVIPWYLKTEPRNIR